MRRLLPLVLVGLLAGCGVLGGNDEPPVPPPPDANLRLNALVAVCDGKAMAQAPDYATREDHRAIVVEGKPGQMSLGPNRLPEDWAVEPPFERIGEVDVVLCGERTAAKAVRLCDDVSGQKNAITWHAATYSYTARSARTAKPLGPAKTIKASGRECPTNVSVGKNHIPLDQYAVVSTSDLEDFAKPFIED